MAKSLFRISEAWRFRSADLPPEWIRRREPLLEGLDENVVFRLIQFRRRTRRWSLGPSLLVILIVVALLVSCSGACFVILLPLVLPFATVFSSADTKMSSILNLPAIHVRDLQEVGISSVDYTIGVWGAAVQRGPILRRRLIWGSISLVLIFFLLFGAPSVQRPDRWAYNSAMCIVLFVCLLPVFTTFFAPWTALPALALRLWMFRQNLDVPRRPLNFILWMIGLLFLLLFAMPFLVVGLFFVMGSVMTFMFGPGAQDSAIHELVRMVSSSPAAMLLVTFAAAGLVTAMWGAWCRKNRDSLLRSIDRNMAKSLDLFGQLTNNRESAA